MKSLVTVLLLVLCGCGGGSITNVPPSAPVTPPPTVTPPPAIPSSWVVTDLAPLPGFNAAQANALNASGHIVGYSEIPTGQVEATEWYQGVATDIGPGVATGINDAGVTVGYYADSTGTFHGLRGQQDIGNWLPLAINNGGTIVGTDLPGTTAYTWDGILTVVPGCNALLAINQKGQTAGYCGGPAVAGSINSLGQTVGYTLSPVDAILFPSTIIAQNGSATGINDYGWVIGETFTALGSNVRVVRGKLFGISHPFIWSQASGLIQLPAPMITAEAIRGTTIVGTQIVGDEIHGTMLDGH